jgi:hypothetical protein
MSLRPCRHLLLLAWHYSWVLDMHLLYWHLHNVTLPVLFVCVAPGRYLEIFARKNNLRNFWVSVGNEVSLYMCCAAVLRRVLWALCCTSCMSVSRAMCHGQNWHHQVASQVVAYTLQPGQLLSGCSASRQ